MKTLLQLAAGIGISIFLSTATWAQSPDNGHCPGMHCPPGMCSGAGAASELGGGPMMAGDGEKGQKFAKAMRFVFKDDFRRTCEEKLKMSSADRQTIETTVAD